MKNKRKVPKEEYDLLLEFIQGIKNLEEKGMKLVEKYEKEHKRPIPNYFTIKIEKYPDSVLGNFLRIGTRANEIWNNLINYYEPIKDFNDFDR